MAGCRLSQPSWQLLGVTLWWQWPAISERPFMDSLAKLLSPEHLPVAVRGKMNVALTDLHGASRERDNERLILDEIAIELASSVQAPME
jgi:hypothetical protein